jgi:hypothetical protein
MRSKVSLWLVIALFSVCAAYADDPPAPPSSPPVPIIVLVGHATEPMGKAATIDEASKKFVSTDDARHLTGVTATRGEDTLNLGLDALVRVLKVEGLPAAPKLIQGESEVIDLKFLDADDAPVHVDYVIESSKPSVALANDRDHTIEGVLSEKVASDTAEIRIKAGGHVVARLEYTVGEAVKSITVSNNSLELNEGGSAVNPGISLIGANTGRAYQFPERTLTLEPNDFVELTSEGWLRAKELPQFRTGPVRAVAIYDSPELLDKSKRARQDATIRLRAGTIEFSPPTALLPAFGETDFLAVLRRRDGTVVPAKFLWTVPATSAPWVAVAPSADRVKVLSIAAASKGMPQIVNLTATATPNDNDLSNDPVSATLPVRLVGSVVAFEPIGVQLTIIDDRTVSDLYGARTAEEYYVARIRFNNNIQNNDGEKKATSFLAFSDSVEVGVTLQKRRTKEALKAFRRRVERNEQRFHNDPYVADDLANDWEPVSERELLTFIEPRAVSDLGTPTEKVRNANTIYEGKSPEGMLPQQPQCTGGLTYRPHTFEMMVNSVDSRSDRSRRSIVFTALSTLGTAASFVTSISPPTAGSVLNATDKFTNLFIPGMAKLFPSLKETQRQNVVAHTMRQIEEIPYGSDLSRILFFPKRTFTGMLPDHEVRIASICPFQFKVQVALLNKGDIKTIGSTGQ